MGTKRRSGPRQTGTAAADLMIREVSRWPRLPRNTSGVSDGPLSLNGNTKDTILIGGDFDDNIYGRDGNDLLFGGNGHDIVYGE